MCIYKWSRPLYRCFVLVSVTPLPPAAIPAAAAAPWLCMSAGLVVVLLSVCQSLHFSCCGMNGTWAASSVVQRTVMD